VGNGIVKLLSKGQLYIGKFKSSWLLISTITSFVRERGFGGLYGVGKAAEHPPALAVLSHTPAAAKERKQTYNLCILSPF
jgi:leucyl aminopeptidase